MSIASAERRVREESRQPDTLPPPEPPRGLRRWIGLLRWAPRYQRADLRGDLAAGLTVAAMLVPQAMAYAQLAGLPPEVGLYASILPVLVYALFGTSRQLAVGPVAIVSLLTASSLAPYVDEGSATYLAAAALLAVVVGVLHLVLGLARLGFLVNLLSHSVLVGFMAAAAIVIGLSQAKYLLGIEVERGEFVETVRSIGSGIADTDPLTLAIGVASIAVLLVLRRFLPLVPGALVVVVLGTVAVTLGGLEDQVATVGEIPDALPALGLPSIDDPAVGSTASLAADLVPAALVITLVGFLESIAIAKVFARRNRYDVDPNQELISLGAADVAAGLSGGFPVTGGFSRTAVNADAGARTPLASILTATIMGLTVVFLTPLFRNLPQAVLAAIVVVAVVGLVDITEMRHLWQVKRSDFAIMVVAFAATLLLGIELGIAVAVVVSLAVVFARMASPHTAELGRVPGTTVYRNVERFPEVETWDDLAVLRVDASLSFANVTYLKRRIEQLQRSHPDARSLVLDCNGVNDIDASAEQGLRELLDDIDQRGVEVHLAAVKGPVRDVLIRSHLWDRFAARLHPTVDDAVACIESRRAPTADLRRTGVDERG